jgi:hypothetical protein
MKQYLLPEGGRFYKANMHMHTTISDGKMTPEEVKEFYRSRGYSIVAFTDHEAILPHNELTDDTFLAITAVEASINDDWPGGHVHNRCYHMNLYAKNPDAVSYPVYDSRYLWPEHAINSVSEECSAVKYRRHYSNAGMNDLIKKANDAGFLVSYNHPVWSLQRYPDYAGLKGLWGVEFYNAGCNRSGYPENTQAFDDLLHLNENVFPLATDDAHEQGTCGFGWIQIKAEQLEYGTVMTALENGDFYASEGGPNITALWFEDGKMHVECDGARRIVFSCGARRCRWAGKDGELTYSAEYEVRPEDYYVRIRLEDNYGRCSYTSAYFVDELLAE